MLCLINILIEVLEGELTIGIDTSENIQENSDDETVYDMNAVSPSNLNPAFTLVSNHFSFT